MEICVDSIESALNAVSGGANRLELCSALSEGGLTPTLGLLKVVKTTTSVPIFVMLRPRVGFDFHFSDLEMKIILEDLKFFKDAGADGFVFGALTTDGDVDIDACMSVIKAAHPLPVTFHRAFDVAFANPIDMAKKIADLGFKRLLTSGRCSQASNGKRLIKSLIEIMKDRLIIMPGAGINVGNLNDILANTLAHEFHGSAKSLKQSNLNFEVYVTNANTVKELHNIYQNYLKKL